MWAGIPGPQRMRQMWRALRDDFAPTPLKKVQPIHGLTRGGLYSFLERLELRRNWATTPRWCATRRPCSGPWPIAPRHVMGDALGLAACPLP